MDLFDIRIRLGISRNSVRDKSTIFLIHLRSVVIIYLSFVPVITRKLPVSQLNGLSTVYVIIQIMHICFLKSYLQHVAVSG